MMTQSYYGGSEFDAFQRQNLRPMANTSYYDRIGPYDHYHEPRHGLRHDYGARHPAHALIQEPEGMETVGGQSRRRIAVACARCRRRKIKCSGDPGDGSGCQACRQSGANVNDCTFNRVSSHDVALAGMPNAASSAAVQPVQYSLTTSSPGSSYGDLGSYTAPHGMHRASLPTLHTRGYASDYDNHYENSPVDAYTYGTGSTPRQDSFASSYGLQDNHRTYSTSAPLSAAISTSFYETHPTYPMTSLGNSRHSHSSTNRLPSVTAESMSALNMGSLHSSLPVHSAPERRLPVPYTVQYSQTGHQTQQLPAPRPIDSATANLRPEIIGIHDRDAMTWSNNGSVPTRDTSLSIHQATKTLPPTYQAHPSHHLADHSGLPTSTPSQSNDFGYTFNTTASYTPDISPTTTVDSYPTLAGPSSLSTMPPPTVRYRNSASALPHSISSSDDLAPLTPSATSSRHREAAASLYSFSTETSERTGSATPSEASSALPAVQNRGGGEVQHAASSDRLRRQSEMAGMGHHGSVRSLNGRQ